MLDKLFKLALEKCNEIKSSAPDTKKLSATYFCRNAFDQLFSDMFETSAKTIITNNNKDFLKLSTIYKYYKQYCISFNISYETKYIFKQIILGLTKLNEKQQEAIQLYFFEELSQEDAAIKAGITQASFSKRLDRALKNLKDILHNSN